MQHLNRILEIDLAKGLAIILAVIGHSFPDAVKGFWIIGGRSFAASMGSFIYSFHMPLFFMCSGFLLAPKLTGGGNLHAQIASRFKRLMIPYLFLSIIYLGGKMIGGALADNPLSGNPIVGILFGNSPCFGAWFLWSLFFMSILVLCLRRINLWLILTVFIAASYLRLDLSVDFKGINSLLSSTMWLVMGCIVRKQYDSISRHLNKYVFFFSLIAILLMHLFADMAGCHNVLWVRTLAITKTVLGITASFSLCYILASRYMESKITKGLQICGDYCMDIYILSMFVLVPLRILYVNVGLMNFIPYYPWLIIASVLGVFLPIVMSKYIVRKVKVLSTLLLGKS